MLKELKIGIKVGVVRRYTLLLVLLGIVMQGVAVFLTRGHNLMLATGFVLVVVGVILWVRQQNRIKS